MRPSATRRPLCLIQTPVKRDGVIVAHAAAEDIERRADGEVHPPLAKLGHPPQVVHRTRAAGVRRRNRRVPGDQLHQCLVDPLAKTLDIDTVNEEFVASLGQGRVHLTIGSALDIFGGDGVRYEEAVAFNRGLN